MAQAGGARFAIAQYYRQSARLSTSFGWTRFLAGSKIEAMKPCIAHQKTAALTRVEVLVVVVVGALLLAIFLPALRSPVRKTKRINCTNLLKQVGLAYYIWASDHNDKFPMNVSITNGGSMELANSGDAASTFLRL